MIRRTCSLVCFCVAVPLAAQTGERLDRGVAALRVLGGVFIGWRLLADDPKDAGFHVYQQAPGSDSPRRLTTGRGIRGGTNHLLEDPTAPADAAYFVRRIDGENEGPASPAVKPPDTPAGASFIRIRLQGRYVAQKAAIGDLDGDGRYDYVIKQPNFNVDPYEAPGYWKKSEDTYKLEAYRGDGTFLWRHDMGWSIEEGIWYSPYVVYDLDGDGRAEVYAKGGEGDPRDPDGRVTSGPEWLLQLDGRTGRVLRKLPWPDRSGFERYNYYCRNLLGIAYLDGRRPHLIIERGTYTQIKIEAYGPQLDPVWRWNSRNEKQKYNGQGMHGMHAADVDGDGRDELVIGSAVIDDDGKGLWSRECGHPDVCYVGEIDPSRPGLEIFYGIEPRQQRDGVCLVEAKTGRKLWGYDGATRHVHSQGMVADLLAEHPGQECYAGEQDASQYWLYTADGRRIGEKPIGGLAPRAAWWNGSSQKQLVLEGRLVDYNGAGRKYAPIEGNVIAIADCLGDWREEVITSVPGELRVYSSTLPAGTRRVCLMQDRLYRLDVAMASMGYFSPPQLGTALFD
ncbi:MAG: silent information regulator protein Sir2 [Phycisphaerae bacterium]|jgi:rhamnogalacturonan endolyase